jgi:TM2 domain-containing membrane protein YozV
MISIGSNMRTTVTGERPLGNIRDAIARTGPPHGLALTHPAAQIIDSPNCMRKTASTKSYGVAVCLSGVFGILGVHHFYLGCWLHGLADIAMTAAAVYYFIIGEPAVGLTILAVDYIHTIVVTIILLTGNYRDGNGCYVTYPGQKLN